MNIQVSKYLAKLSKWREEMNKMRNVIMDCGLQEDFKWGHPCYTFQGKNIVLIHGFKDYCALLFHKGALLQDKKGILVQQTKNVQAARQLRFRSLTEIFEMESTIKTYIFEAMEVEKAGLEVKMKETEEFEIVDELLKAFQDNQELEKAFKTLTPGRQRGYLLYFSQAKQSSTRANRIEKSIPRIFEGKGPNER